MILQQQGNATQALTNNAMAQRAAIGAFDSEPSLQVGPAGVVPGFGSSEWFGENSALMQSKILQGGDKESSKGSSESSSKGSSESASTGNVSSNSASQPDSEDGSSTGDSSSQKSKPRKSKKRKTNMRRALDSTFSGKPSWPECVGDGAQTLSDVVAMRSRGYVPSGQRLGVESLGESSKTSSKGGTGSNQGWSSSQTDDSPPNNNSECSNNGSNNGSNTGSNKSSNDGSNNGSNQGSHDGSKQGSSDGSHQGSNDGSNQGSKAGSNDGSSTGSNNGSNDVSDASVSDGGGQNRDSPPPRWGGAEGLTASKTTKSTRKRRNRSHDKRGGALYPDMQTAWMGGSGSGGGGGGGGGSGYHFHSDSSGYPMHSSQVMGAPPGGNHGNNPMMLSWAAHMQGSTRPTHQQMPPEWAMNQYSQNWGPQGARMGAFNALQGQWVGQQGNWTNEGGGGRGHYKSH